jgi:hypothetical protein
MLTDCSDCAIPIETFRFIGASYFLTKYYFNTFNANNSNTVLLHDDLMFVELLMDQSNGGGTLYMYFSNTLIKKNVTNELIQDIELHLNFCLLFDSMDYLRCPKEYSLVSKSILNSTDLHNLLIHVPYPMMGKWYLALWKTCRNQSTKLVFDSDSL